MRCSKVSRLRRAFNDERSRSNISYLLRRCAHCGADRLNQAIPAGSFFAQTFSTGRTQTVKPGFAFVFTFAPIRVDQSLMLETVKRGIKGSLGNLQSFSRDLLYPQQHAVTVKRPEGNSFENKHVQKS